MKKEFDKDKYIVISLGGSLVVPGEIDIDFVRNFSETIKNYVSLGFKFLIIVGGGRICRKYNEILKSFINPKNEDLDWLGIRATRLNAEFIRITLADIACESILLDPNIIPETNKSVIVGGGWKPGNSSDLATIRGAKALSSKIVVNLSNIDYVYDKNPHEFQDAKPIKEISWPEFHNLFEKEWAPGTHIPFDTRASKEASELGMEVLMLNGKNLDNFKNLLDGKEFVGTIIG